MHDQINRLVTVGAAGSEQREQLEMRANNLEAQLDALTTVVHNAVQSTDTLSTGVELTKRNTDQTIVNNKKATDASLAAQTAVQAATNATVAANKALQDLIDTRTNLVAVTNEGHCEIKGDLDILGSVYLNSTDGGVEEQWVSLRPMPDGIVFRGHDINVVKNRLDQDGEEIRNDDTPISLLKIEPFKNEGHMTVGAETTFNTATTFNANVTSAGNNTFTGTNTFNGTLTVPSPTNGTDAASKAYVDSTKNALLTGNNAFTGTNTFGSTTLSSASITNSTGSISFGGSDFTNVGTILSTASVFTTLASAFTTSGAIQCNGTLNVVGASTLASATVTNNATVGGTLAVINNAIVGGTLGVTGATTVDGLTAGASTLASAAVTNNATVGGTLGVTGDTTVDKLTTGALTVGSAQQSSTATVYGNATVTGTLSSVTSLYTSGVTTTASIALSGKAGNITRSGALGAIDLDTLADTGSITYTAIGAPLAPAFGSGFANFGAAYGFAPAAIVARPLRNNQYHVSLEGCVCSLSGGQATPFPPNSIIFTLPSAYRPTKGQYTFRCAGQDNINPLNFNTTMRVDINTSGHVTVNPGNSGPVDANGHPTVDLLFLSNISFYVIA